MTARRWLAAAALGAGLLVAPGTPEALTGEEWLQHCSGEAGAADTCGPYLQALIDAGKVESDYLRSGCSTSKCRVEDEEMLRGFLAGAEWCLPNASVRDAAGGKVRKWLSENPIERQGPAPEAIARALAALWPCER